MPPDDSQTVFLTTDLGLVGNFDPTAPLARVIAKNSLHSGRIFLRATLDELIKIRNMARSSSDDNLRELLQETRVQYDNLMRRATELESLRKRTWITKLLTLPSTSRTKRTFASDAFELWDSTKATTSDRLKRTFLSTPTTDLAPVESEAVDKNEQISGLAVDMNGPVTQEAIAALQDAMSLLASGLSGGVSAEPAPDSQVAQSSTVETPCNPEELLSARSSISTSPGSPGSAPSFSLFTVNRFTVNTNIVSNTDSAAPGLTINNNGSENSGSLIGDRPTTQNAPS